MAHASQTRALIRWAVPFVAVGAVSLLTTGYLTSQVVQRHFLRQAQTRLGQEASLLEPTAAALLARSGDPASWAPLAGTWSRFLNVRVTVLDTLEDVIADSGIPESDQPGRDDARIVVVQPLRWEGQQLGALHLTMPMAALKHEQHAIRNLILVILLITITVLAGIAIHIAARTRGPLLRLTETAARFSRGEWDARVPIDPYCRADEFSELSHDFNRMADEVQLRFDESRRQHDQLETVLANMSDGVLAVDVAGIVRLVNQAFLRFFRSVHPDPIGRPYGEAFRDRHLNELIERVLGGLSGDGEELEVLTPRRRILVFRTALIAEARAEEVRAVLVARDVTARRQVEQMRRDFVANVSHELRTPLTSILGYVAALRETSTDETQHQAFLDTIARNAERMNRIVGDLLDLSRIEAPDYRPQPVPFDLATVVDEVLAPLRNALDRKSQIVEVRIAPDAESLIADREAVGRILLNLLDNANKYSPEGSAITVEAKRDGDEIVLSVADQGIGVPESDRPRLFERFFRVDRGRSRDLGGTGLGLAIVKHLAESHGGSASYESNAPIGSRFVIRIPQPS